MILFTACDDEIFPKGDLEENYVLSCVLNGDTNYQVAFLTRTYDVESFDPYTSTINPVVRDARVSLFYEGTTYFFRDTIIAGSAESRYPGNQYLYYLDDFKPERNKTIVIQAVLQDGTTLRSEINSFPYRIRYGSFYRSDFIIPPEDPTSSELFFKWGDYEETVYFIPRLSIVYSRIIDGVEQKFEKLVPQTIEGSEELYPGLQTGDYITYDLDAFEYSFEAIAEDGIPREEYRIHNAVFKVLVADESLATYYSAAKTFADSYTVQVTEPEYTNIEGGFGVFGSFASCEINVTINNNYIDAFGYTPAWRIDED